MNAIVSTGMRTKRLPSAPPAWPAPGPPQRRRGSSLGQGIGARPGCRRRVRLCGAHHRHLLPPEQPLAAAAAENVEFFATAAEAEAAGYRASKRAEDDAAETGARHAAIVAAACRRIEAADTPPTLETLAAQAGLSLYHFHRIFKSLTGLTPKALPTRIARGACASGWDRRPRSPRPSTTPASSQQPFYAASDGMLGMTASRWRAGGADMAIRFAIGQCSLGAITVAQSQRGVCAILLGDDPDALARELQDQFPKAELIGGDSGFEQLVARVVGFIEAPSIGLDLPWTCAAPPSSCVWQALREIPPGTTASYAEIAARRRAKAVRAWQTCAANHRRWRSPPPRGAQRWCAVRLPLGRGAQTRG